MTSPRSIRASEHLTNIRYEIRGTLARRADQLVQAGYDVIRLNIGNPGAFGFRMPESMRRAIVENLWQADPYCHQKGIFPAREAVVMQQQDRGLLDLSAADVFIGNGVSELILLCMRALLNPGDEVLVPSPDYPLWTAAVNIHGGRAVHYPCPRELRFHPDLDALEQLITPKTRALVVINPNNPTGAVYSEADLRSLVALARKHQLLLLADEIYDGMTFDGVPSIPLATVAEGTLCATFGGLSKIYRACGLRVGWVSFSGDRAHASEYLAAIELLASLRLCSNVPGQWAVQTALGGYQSIRELMAPGGRLHEARAAIAHTVSASRHLDLIVPDGSIYAFVRVKGDTAGGFNDERFALDLLERKHILIAPGNSFNVPYSDHFRITLLPEPETLQRVVNDIDELIDETLT